VITNPSPRTSSAINPRWLPLRALLAVLVLPGNVAGVIPWLLVDRPIHLLQGAPLVAALAALALGLVIFASCVLDFALRGRGTLAPVDPPKRLVVEGLYRYSRNPMYVGLLLILLSQAALCRSRTLLIYSAIVTAMFHLWTVFYEEPRLRKSFGPEYEDYCRRIGRWWTLTR